ncbi:hypothetical protein Y032_0743g1988 [Ancylostoma ceylanicum]|nr:hypothetical protein Y032_0743g1988 [Ancylostoma ceylanicum]
MRSTVWHKLRYAWDRVLNRSSTNACSRNRPCPTGRIMPRAKKRPICGDIAVDTEPSVAILVSATPVNAVDLACYEWSSLMYHVVKGILYSVGYGMRKIHKNS